MAVIDNLFTGLSYGQDTVAIAGSAEALNDGSTLTVPNGSRLLIQGLGSNTDLVYVGDSGVSSSNGYELSAGQVVSLAIDDVSTVYIDVGTDGEGVSWILEVP